MKYIYANFTDSCVNWGNLIIDYATRLMIEQTLGSPAAEFDSFVGVMPASGYDFAIVPGCTMITDGDNPTLSGIYRVNYPTYCLAGAVWGREPRSLTIGGLRLRLGRRSRPTLGIARQLSGTVGARDPFTKQLLDDAKIRALYVGCPTLLLPPTDVSDGGYVLLSFGRGATAAQAHYGARLAKRANVVAVCHEIGDYDRFRAAGWRLPLEQYNGDLQAYLGLFKNASAVVTGRLHGVLPAMAFNKHVMYFGTRDTRTTILDDLGVRVWNYRDIATGHLSSRAVECARHQNMFRGRWRDLLQTIRGRHLEAA